MGEKREDEPWRVLEFYSGIGGMRYSLLKAGLNAKIVEAFDINNKANDVYEHNFGHRPYQGNIQTLTVADLDSYQAHAWLLSPPCQPYTRQGLQKQSGDARAFSFLKILELIHHSKKPPSMLFVENVVGFETSDTHSKMMETLANSDFVVQEFILSPLQFGVPYSRPRYFCLAKRKPLSFQHEIFNNLLLWSPGPLLKHTKDNVTDQWDQPPANWDMVLHSCEPVYRFLEFDNSSNLGGAKSGNDVSADCFGAPENMGETNRKMMEPYFVPLSLIERWGSAMDIVYPDSKRCCCFTKSYYRFVKGTGSLLATSQMAIQPKEEEQTSSLKELGLRYFTPREVANLHSFPKDFQFPQNISLRQRYAMLGNSVSIAVVAPLLSYLFSQQL